jgi:predicted TIM-barrel fold metal-dependent hydrolase
MADIFSEPKVDSHCHILDPVRFPYAADVVYRPQGQEIGDQQSLESVMASHGVRHALLVGPNSGYNLDNRCMLHAIATGAGRFKGIAVVPTGVDTDTLVELQSRGVVGVAMNLALNGLEYYAAELPSLLRQLEALNLWAQFQVEADQLVDLLPYLKSTRGRLLFDHCGRPMAAKGIAQPGFQALLALGREGRAVVKLSGEVKFSEQRFPFHDARPYWDALIESCGVNHCIWASDWPYLKAPFRLDYGPMLQRWESYLSAGERRSILWDNPCRFFGFGLEGHDGS